MIVYVVTESEDYAGEVLVAVYSNLTEAIGEHEWVGPIEWFEYGDPKETMRRWTRKIDDTSQMIIREIPVRAS